MSHAEPIDGMLNEILTRASDGLNFDHATRAIADGVEAIANMMAELKLRGWREEQTHVIARAAAQTQKAMDELYRLVQFAKGAPDSRPDMGADWLRGLTTAQLSQVQRWVEENAAKETP